MSKESETFCILPWVHFNVNPDGGTTLCCVSTKVLEHSDSEQSQKPAPSSTSDTAESQAPNRGNNEGRQLSLQSYSAKEIWSSSAYKDIRKALIEGKKIEHCDYCYRAEEFGQTSHRQHWNKKWESEHGVKSTSELLSEVENPKLPQYFDIRLGNTCNLKCTVCKPLYSSQIQKDEVHSKWSAEAPFVSRISRFGETQVWFENADLVDELFEFSKETRILQLAGGEPMINKTQIALLEGYVAKNFSKDIELELVTNLIPLRQQLIDLYSKFKKLSVAVSCDGFGEGYELVRYPAKWKVFEQNMELLRRSFPDSTISINAVIQSLNAYNISELIQWGIEKGVRINISIGRGLENYNDMRILPPQIRNKARQKLEEVINRMSNRDTFGLTENIANVFNELDQVDFEDDVRQKSLQNMMRFVNDLELSGRKAKFKNAMPELFDDIVSYAGSWNHSTMFLSQDERNMEI